MARKLWLSGPSIQGARPGRAGHGGTCAPRHIGGGTPVIAKRMESIFGKSVFAIFRDDPFYPASAVRVPGAALTVVGDGWFADNPDGLLTAHVHSNGDGTGNVAGGLEATLYVIKLGLVPDYDRDGVIDDADINTNKFGEPLRIWVNDDDDAGDTAEAGGTDIPGQAAHPDCGDLTVDGRRDLLDFFPVWLDLKDALIAFPPQSGMTFQLRSKGLRFVYTALTKDRAGKYLREECAVCGPAFNQNAHEALTFAPGDGQLWGPCVELSEAFLDQIRADGDKGVLLVECSSPLASLELEIVDQSGAPVAGRRLHLRASRVEDMYNRVNLRGGPAVVTAGAALPPSNGKHAVFVHGFNVDAQKARAWNADMFKRLWQSGSNARFHGVTWKGDIGQINGLNFREDVVSAFAAAQHIRDYVVSSLSGEKIVMAHSLGNMVVSSAIADYGMGVGKYFMLNAAVPAEAYDPGLWSTTVSANNMVHRDWINYLPRTWSALYHQLFDPDLVFGIDDRYSLTWKGRFAACLPGLYNYYSSGDEVFEQYGGTPDPEEGLTFHFGIPVLTGTERYSWQKQELYKGRDGMGEWAGLFGTDSAGWGFELVSVMGEEPHPIYTAAEANAFSDAELADPVYISFRHVPDCMFANPITAADRSALLAKAIPSLSGATGNREIRIDESDVVNVNMNNSASSWRPNGWGRMHDVYQGRWLHSDLKNMSYFYNHKIFDSIVEQGELQ